MPFHTEHAQPSPVQLVVAGLAVLLLAILLIWSFREGRARIRSEPAPAVTPATAAPMPGGMSGSTG